MLEGFLAGADEEAGAECGEDGDGGHLEEDARDHDVGAGFGVASGCTGGVGGEGAADSLDDEGDDIAGAEDPEVEFWADGGGTWAFDSDELAEDDVDACCEESWGCKGFKVEVLLAPGDIGLDGVCLRCGGLTDDQGRNLHEEGVVVVRTKGTPGAACPADHFCQGTYGEYLIHFELPQAICWL